MAKTQEELNVLKEEFETLNQKLRELTEEELKQVTGGKEYEYHIYSGEVDKEFKPEYL